jgi:hypothetical protein
VDTPNGGYSAENGTGNEVPVPVFRIESRRRTGEKR